jgi:hypothetical protein
MRKTLRGRLCCRAMLNDERQVVVARGVQSNPNRKLPLLIFSVRRPVIRVLLALVVGLTLVAGGLTPQLQAPFHLAPGEALAADASVATCTEAGFDAALTTV